jgi:hypothetical protein
VLLSSRLSLAVAIRISITSTIIVMLLILVVVLMPSHSLLRTRSSLALSSHFSRLIISAGTSASPPQSLFFVRSGLYNGNPLAHPRVVFVPALIIAFFHPHLTLQHLVPPSPPLSYLWHQTIELAPHRSSSSSSISCPYSQAYPPASPMRSFYHRRWT